MRVAVAFWLAWLAMAPALAVAQSPGTAAGEAAILVIHAWPDPRAGTDEADPFSSARAKGGTLAAQAARLPTTVFDGVDVSPGAPEGRPESALAHFRAFQDLLRLRANTGAGAIVRLDATIDDGSLRIAADVAPRVPSTLNVSFVVFEDGAPYRDAEGARLARFVARADVPGASVPGEVSIERVARLDPAWSVARLGVVAIVRHGDEVVQAAVWRAGQEGATLQEDKLVLVEHVTATWCDACRGADEAIALMATRAGGFVADGPFASYARAPTPAAIVGALAGLTVAVALVRRRAP